MESHRKTAEPRSCSQTSFEGLEKVDRIVTTTEELRHFFPSPMLHEITQSV